MRRSDCVDHQYWRYNFWLHLAGAGFLIAGLIAVRRELSLKRDGLLPLGRVFVAMAIATFGAEHLTSADHIKDLVPSWIPWHLFWAYFVGVALIAAAVSLVTSRRLGLAMTLLGAMFTVFVITMHIPTVIGNPGDRFAWAVLGRDTVFGLGAWALARRFVPACRVGIGVVALFFAVEHFLHPSNLPGVPLEQATLAWIPLRPAWGIFLGVALLVCGGLIVAKKISSAEAHRKYG